MDVQVLWQKLHWHKRKLTKHIACKKFLNYKKWMCCRAHLKAMIKQGDQCVPNAEQQALFRESASATSETYSAAG